MLLALSLLSIGLLAISSASIEYAQWQFENPWYHTTKHLVYIAISLVVALGVYAVPPGFWQETGWVWLFIALALLILVLIPGIGKEVNGSQRWLPLGPLTLQPSEFTKVALVIYFAGYLVRKEREVRTRWRGFLKPMGVLIAVSGLLMVEPDFGATVIGVWTAIDVTHGFELID